MKEDVTGVTAVAVAAPHRCLGHVVGVVYAFL